MKERLRTLIEHLNHGLVEREAAIKAALLAMLAGENMLLVGPPGTAKSLIARKLAKCLDEGTDSQAGKEYFEYLLTKFTTPEEIFGPLSISELKQDHFKRNTAGYLPSVRVAFLDEIFKASSSILNTLLTILNERTYHNGTEALDVPLQALIAASNELPPGQEELEALYDRFLVRSVVDYVSAENMPRLLEKTVPLPALPQLTKNEIEVIRQAAEEVQLPADIVSALQRIWAEHKRMFKEDRREKLSDRRLKKAVHLLRISAASNGRGEVDLSDIFLLRHCLWNHQDNAAKVSKLVMDTLRSFSRAVPRKAESAAGPGGTPPAQLNPAGGKTGAVIKGYKGSGTEHDPILIKTLHDLAGLERPDVGQKGYYFRQTADIDCSSLDSWLDISFSGHYDGAGRAIIYNDETEFLFREAKQSTVSNLRLTELGLAKVALDSQITGCDVSGTLLESARNSQITACVVGSDIVDELASNCSITQCRSGKSIADALEECVVTQCATQDVLVRTYARSSTIQDCYVCVSREYIGARLGFGGYGNRSIYGGIVKESEGSVVERCFVTAKVLRPGMSGIAGSCIKSTIRQCAIGAFESHIMNLHGCIASEVKSSTLQDNVALDCHRGQSEPDGKNGKSLPSALFTAHYLEHTLSWDFDTVWQWSGKRNEPELRSVGLNAKKMQSVRQVAPTDKQDDLLNQQLSANIWI